MTHYSPRLPILLLSAFCADGDSFQKAITGDAVSLTPAISVVAWPIHAANYTATVNLSGSNIMLSSGASPMGGKLSHEFGVIAFRPQLMLDGGSGGQNFIQPIFDFCRRTPAEVGISRDAPVNRRLILVEQRFKLVAHGVFLNPGKCCTPTVGTIAVRQTTPHFSS